MAAHGRSYGRKAEAAATQAVFTLVTRVKNFDVVRVDVRNGLYQFLMSFIGFPVKIDVNSEISTLTSTFLTPTAPIDVKTPSGNPGAQF